MAVFTEVSVKDAESLLCRYEIGRVLSLVPISSGIENTNYFLETQREGEESKRWVLTIFENLVEADLPYFCALTSHLSRDGFLVPAPVLMRSGEPVFTLNQKRGVIVPCFAGKACRFASVEACRALGTWVANMHISLAEFDGHRPYVRNLAWMNQHAANLEGAMNAADYEELAQAIERFEKAQPLLEKCPQGPVHGDLFHDNVLFENSQISGVIDFYNASDAPWLYDLAVAANDWTINHDGSRDALKLAALVEAYQECRPWTSHEIEAWPYFLELAALSFWVSRLSSFHLHTYQKGGLVAGDVLKEPDEMRDIMRLSRVSSPSRH